MEDFPGLCLVITIACPEVVGKMAVSTTLCDLQRRNVRRVAILGHSYVSNLEFRSPLTTVCFEIRKFGSPGAKITDITERKAWQDMLIYRPELTLLVLGGNDINQDTTPSELGRKIKDLALEVEWLTGGVCLILNIEPRLQPRDISVRCYTSMRHAVNRCLGRLPDSKYRLRGMAIRNEDLARDGVHLNPAGNERLLRRIIEIIEKFWRTQQQQH